MNNIQLLYLSLMLDIMAGFRYIRLPCWRNRSDFNVKSEHRAHACDQFATTGNILKIFIFN